MKLFYAHQPPIQSLFLSSVSLPVIQLGYGVIPELECNDYQDISAYDQKNIGVWSLLVWIRLLLNWLCGVRLDEARVAQAPYTPNRRGRRTRHCSISFVRYYHHYWKLCPKGLMTKLTPTQFLEWVCRLSPLGRIRIYMLRQYGTVLRRRAMLICYDHGWWRAPIGAFGRVYCGIWHVHLLPGWHAKADF